MNRDKCRSSGERRKIAPISASAGRIAASRRWPDTAAPATRTGRLTVERGRKTHDRVPPNARGAARGGGGEETRPSRRRRRRRKKRDKTSRKNVKISRALDKTVEISRRKTSFAEERWKSGIDKYTKSVAATARPRATTFLSSWLSNAFVITAGFLYYKRGR